MRHRLEVLRPASTADGMGQPTDEYPPTGVFVWASKKSVGGAARFMGNEILAEATDVWSIRYQPSIPIDVTMRLRLKNTDHVYIITAVDDVREEHCALLVATKEMVPPRVRA